MPADGMPMAVFVSHGFAPQSAAYDLTQYRRALERVFEETATILSRIGLNIRFVPTFQNYDFGKLLGLQIAQSIGMSDCAIVDITDGSPNVMYELGYLDALTTPLVLIRSSKSTTPIPIDLAGRLFVEYDLEQDLPYRLAPILANCVQASLRRYSILPADRDAIWFPPDVPGIHIVVGHSPDDLYSADPKYPNFVYVEQFSDKDALLELMTFLSRTYKARVHKYTSRDFPQRQLLRENLVVVGGPGIEGMNNGNAICREMQRRVRARLTYAPDGESLTFLRDKGLEPEKLTPTYSDDGMLLTDYGYFARFANPFEPDAVVVMIHGLHTAGVLGAALAFSDRPQASANFRIVREVLGDGLTARASFEVLVEVERMAGEVLVPRIEPSNVYAL